jgi:hypothetical protein
MSSPDSLAAVRTAAEALRESRGATELARATLHQTIREAAEAGASLSAIARAAGVSRQWIANVLEHRDT